VSPKLRAVRAPGRKGASCRAVAWSCLLFAAPAVGCGGGAASSGPSDAPAPIDGRPDTDAGPASGSREGGQGSAGGVVFDASSPATSPPAGPTTGASPPTGSTSDGSLPSGIAVDGAAAVPDAATGMVGDGAGAVAAPAPANPAQALGSCTAPVGASWSDARAAYAKWKSDLLTSDGARGFLRVLRPNSPNAIDTSNSEGIAYGMILAAAMDDQSVFDSLWKYEQLFLDGNGLMNWEIDPTGSGPTSEGTGAATDADEDMAFALLWADERWGGQGSIGESYQAAAVKLIDDIWQFEVDPSRGDALAPGDQFGGASVVNISYFAPAYYRLFGKATGKVTDWNSVVETSYTILAAALNAANKNATNGLVPAWSTPAGVPQAPNASLPTNYQLDSCRTPFRIGQDFCWYGEARAKSYLAKVSAFYQQVGAANIVNGYDLDGTPAPTNPTVHQSAAFVGPAGVGAMSDAVFSTLRDSAYAGVATLGELDGSTYYTESWTALSLVMTTGGYWNPSLP
jgi:endo-1,4-beta-D-glucanase Y